MMHPVLCDDCFEKIAKISTAAAHLWVELCDYQMEFNIFSIHPINQQLLKVLEENGYIVTSEIPPDLYIKVIEETTFLGTIFCTGKCND